MLSTNIVEQDESKSQARNLLLCASMLLCGCGLEGKCNELEVVLELVWFFMAFWFFSLKMTL